MSELTRGVYRLTQVSAIYAFYQRALGSDRARRRIAEEAFELRPGIGVLDLGCGHGDVLPYLGDVTYVGIDRNEDHISSARSRYGKRGTFHCGDFRDAAQFTAGGFDRILCLGLLHHLDDERVHELATLARELIAPDGRLIAVDPAFTAGQHWIARTLAKRDSGQCVRTPDNYRKLLSDCFANIETRIYHDLLRVPYTHCITIAAH